MMRKKEKKEDPLAWTRKVRPDTLTPTDQENHIAKVIDGKRHIGSGAIATLKSDASNERYQIECKQTEQKSMSLKLEWIEKITNEAAGQSKVPMMHLRFLNVCIGTDRDWIVMPEREFKKLNARRPNSEE